MSLKNDGFDHMTVVVSDLEDARRFFGLLGFVERVAVTAEGEEISRYMGISGWKAEHVTLELKGAPTHQEVQLLSFHDPPARSDEAAGTLDRVGFNHVCFRVADLSEALRELASHGIRPRSGVLEFHDRKLAFVDGPGLVVELAEWEAPPG